MEEKGNSEDKSYIQNVNFVSLAVEPAHMSKYKSYRSHNFNYFLVLFRKENPFKLCIRREVTIQWKWNNRKEWSEIVLGILSRIPLQIEKKKFNFLFSHFCIAMRNYNRENQQIKYWRKKKREVMVLLVCFLFSSDLFRIWITLCEREFPT